MPIFLFAPAEIEYGHEHKKKNWNGGGEPGKAIKFWP